MLEICGSGKIIFMSANIWYDRKDVTMSIQIFGTKKCADIRKADRFFKERGIKYLVLEYKQYKSK